MDKFKDLLKGYDNMDFVHYEDIQERKDLYKYNELGDKTINGVLKANLHVDGELVQLYSEENNHVGVIAATRLGKTTSYVIPTILSFAKQKTKKSMIISDPKGEIYRYTVATLKKEGYRVILLNFRDYLHSECWNLLTPIYKKYKRAMYIEGEVQDAGSGKKSFRGRIYKDKSKLSEDVQRAKDLMLADVSNDIDNVCVMFVDTKSKTDPYWEDSARDLLKAFIWAMLEDSDKNNPNPITENTFSFSTILTIIGSFQDGDSAIYADNGYFTERSKDSRAYLLAKNTLLENGRPTRKCIMSSLMSKLAVFNEIAMRLITSCNSFEMSELLKEPVAVFIDYRDELKVHYQIISLFVQDAYRYFIEQANARENKKLETPFYFILDEFGNFPALKDFETTISACAGRNIFFILIVQSYAQLNAVYGKEIAEIIRDNLNIHIFFGSNNPSTLKEFSTECGQQTRISPLSALNGKGADIDNYVIETIPLVPISRLSRFSAGECIVTEANSGYVLFSMLERFFLSKEFQNLELSSENDYKCKIDPFEQKYTYKLPAPKKKSGINFDDLY